MPAWAPLSFPATNATVPNDGHRVEAESSCPATAFSGLDSGAVVARLDAGERLMGPVESNAPAQGPCWLPVGYRTPTAMVDLDRAPDVGWGPSPVGPTSGAGSPMPPPDEAVRGASERSESEKRRPDGEARNEPTRRVTNRAGASERS
jgi:hypothetical protein